MYVFDGRHSGDWPTTRSGCAISNTMNLSDLQIPKTPVTLRHMVEEKLRAAIAAGVFKPGQRLVERELCELIGVGRTSVREALRQLEAEGLVETVPHRGPAVRSISVDEARQLYDVRALLEGYAARAFAENPRPELLERLRRSIEELRQAVRKKDHRALVNSKTGFYDILMEGGGNLFIREVLTGLHNRINMLRFTSMTQPGRLRQSLQEVRAIYDAIASGDADAAEAASRRHIEAAAVVALAVLEGTSHSK